MCTSIAVGKNATKNGVNLISRNEDFGQNNWNKYLKYRSEPQYTKIDETENEEKWTLGNGLVVDKPKKRYKYCSIPDAEGNAEATHPIGDNFYFEERGVNEKNVAVSATNSMDANEESQKFDHFVSIGIEEAVIATLILPQADSALNAVEILGNYVEKYGACEANGILFADINEIWYFEIGSAHHWIAVKIPDNSCLVVANCMRIRGINLDDKENVKYSKNIFEFVNDNALLKDKKADRKNFDFATAFGCTSSNVHGVVDENYNLDRIWLAQYLLTPEQDKKPKPRQKEYPLMLEISKKLTVSDVAKILRATYEGTELKDATRPIGIVATTESHIIEMDSSMPYELQGIIWQAVSSPLGAPYMPIFAITDNIPESYSLGDSNYHKDSAYWSFRALYSLSKCCENKDTTDILSFWQEYENQFIESHDGIKALLKNMYKDNPNKAIAFAKRYSIGVLCQTTEKANSELNKLITDIAVHLKTDY